MARARLRLRMSRGLRELFERGDKGLAVEAGAAGVEAALLHWHRKIMPGHFDESAYGEYPGAYRPLTPAYIRQKRNRRPMFFTGTTLRTLSSGSSITIRKTRAKASGVLRLPFARAVNLWRGGRRKHDFVRAISAMNTADQIELRQVMQQAAQDYVQRLVEQPGSDVRTFEG